MEGEEEDEPPQANQAGFGGACGHGERVRGLRLPHSGVVVAVFAPHHSRGSRLHARIVIVPPVSPNTCAFSLTQALGIKNDVVVKEEVATEEAASEEAVVAEESATEEATIKSAAAEVSAAAATDDAEAPVAEGAEAGEAAKALGAPAPAGAAALARAGARPRAAARAEEPRRVVVALGGAEAGREHEGRG